MKPSAVRMLADLSELRDGREAALELFQYAVDSEGSDAQTWVVGVRGGCDAVLPQLPP